MLAPARMCVERNVFSAAISGAFDSWEGLR